MIHIYCDGGLGNRLLMMFSGLYFAKKADKQFIIHWPVNNWCGCNFSDLFDNKYNISNFNLKFVDEHILQSCTLLVHEMQIKHKQNKILNNASMTKDNIIETYTNEPDILYYGNSLHNSLTPNDVTCVIDDLKVTGQILNMISNYKTSGCFGVHIRGTDFPEQAYVSISQIENEIRKNNNEKYFICSDQKDIEMSFKTKFSNTIVFEKTSYVERLDKTKGWNGRITDDLNRSFNFNVNRNRMSVIEAFCDMLLLSKTKLLKTSNSSFLNCAYALSKGQLS